MTFTFCNPTTQSPFHSSSLFPQITSYKTIKDLHQVHAHFIKTRQIHDPLAAAEILCFYALSTHHSIQYTGSVFTQMEKPNCFSWNTIIRTFAKDSVNDHSHDALFFFSQMVADGFVGPNKFTFLFVLKACAKMGNLEVGKCVHAMVVKFRLENDGFVMSNLLRMYVMCEVMKDANLLFYRSVGDFDVLNGRKQEGNVVLWNVIVDGCVRLGDFTARELFHKMPQRSVVSWNAMISGYTQHRLFKEAVEMFRDIQIGTVCPNYVTLVNVVCTILDQSRNY
ncbi:hypothetical protein ACFX13_003997 [Malus domestica]